MKSRQPRPLHALLQGVLLSAVVTTGLTAGVFADWAHTIMPGLGTADDRVFIEVFQSLDRAILNPVFLLGFLGAAAFTGIAVVLSVRSGDRSLRRWAVASSGLYIVAVVVTMTVHEPLNTVLRNAGTPGILADPATLRADFDESRWIAWHLVRTVAATAALAGLARALVLAGRQSSTRLAPKERIT